jgi:abortive infection Abi-like protein
MAGQRDLIRAGVRNLLKEYWAGTSLGYIGDSFQAAGFQPDETFVSRSSGQRRALVDQYYAAIDWKSAFEVNRFLAEVVQPVFANLCAQVETDASNAGYATRTLSQLTTLLQVDGFKVKDGRIHLMATSALIEQARKASDVEALASMLPRLEDADDDPWLAIGTAKEIIEHIAQVVITRSGGQAPKDADLGDLTKGALKALDLLPSEVPDAKKGAESIRRVLQGLVQIVQGTAELRNLYGTGHGRAQLARVYGRHARLVVGAALAWAHFASETWEVRQARPTS